MKTPSPQELEYETQLCSSGMGAVGGEPLICDQFGVSPGAKPHPVVGSGPGPRSPFSTGFSSLALLLELSSHPLRVTSNTDCAEFVVCLAHMLPLSASSVERFIGDSAC